MIASLPMYDRPETAAAHDRLWSGIRRALGFGPARLRRGAESMDEWRAPELLLSQTCGMPYRHHLHGAVQLVGTPIWTLDDPPGYYHSVLVTRADDPRDTLTAFKGARLAYNMATSQSGWAAPQTEAQGLGFAFTDVLETGGHRASARAVADARADLAAIDAITWQLITRSDPWAAKLRVFGRTRPTPTLPYITAKKQDADALFEAMTTAIDGLSAADRDTLYLRGITRIAAADYLAIPSPPFP